MANINDRLENTEPLMTD